MAASSAVSFVPAPPPGAGGLAAPPARHVILVLSGKGGVGKSTVACQLAAALATGNHGGGGGERPTRVGILDVDLCGPSVPTIMGTAGRPVTRRPDGAMRPAVASLGQTAGEGAGGRAGPSVAVMSIAPLLPSAVDAVVWRGPRKVAMVREFLRNVAWADEREAAAPADVGGPPLDFLLIDTPPGTSDEQLTLCEELAGAAAPTGAVVVTTPQLVATDDVRKELDFCGRLGLRCLGIVENMSGFVCPHCANCCDVFGRGGGRRLAEQFGVPFLGAVPLDPALSAAQDRGAVLAAHAAPAGVAGSAAAVAAGSTAVAQAQASAALGAVVDAVLLQCRRVDDIRTSGPVASSAAE